MMQDKESKIIAFNNFIIKNSNFFEMLDAMRSDFVANFENINDLTLKK